ncbi:hypothetical protein PVAP13_1NG233119 [Panicum virgatum]|uniref:RING-type domain-containing protein n=1 Tax=Panicum virgatum TaxID=38727 RepID=A0A8T0WJ37_PANVG|nr:hypothetical protein PVAP13_1NG233119 [Panicum virgatum]
MDMAGDCMTRVCALAIATAACVGLPGALVYAIVRTAAARRFGATAAFSLVLVFWVTVSAAYYPLVCADVVRGSALVRRARARQPRGGAPLPRSAPAERRGGRGGRTRRNGSPAPAHERRAARAPRDHDGETPEPCAVCLCDVQKGEAATWLPACQHVFHFHQHCIHQWQHLHGHPTCPICWSDAYVAPPPPLQGGHSDTTTALPQAPPSPPPPPPPPAVRGRDARVVVDTLASYGSGSRKGASMVSPPFMARGPQEEHHRGMTTLPREQPAGRIVAADVILASSSHERRQPDGGETSERCAVCLCDVEKQGETLMCLPACLHVFHRHCINQWLHLHGHSTCPICRSDAFAAAAAGANGVTFSSFRSVPDY